MSGDGPVYEAVLRLGDVTVLTGPNDSGKTRVLRFIKQGLMGADYPDYLGVELDVFGVAEASEIDDFLRDRDDPPSGIVGAESDAVAAFGSAVELPTHPHGVRVGVLCPGHADLLPGWRYGRALIDLDERTRAAVEQQREIGGLDEKEPEEPLCLEPLGSFDPRILPEAIMVPCAAADMELRVASAVTRLTRALRALAFAWRRVVGIAGLLSGGPSPDWVTDGPAGLASEVNPSWEWLLEEDEDSNVSRVHPAAVEACAVMDRMLSVLLPGFISDDYWVRVVPGQPTAIACGRYVRIRLLRRESSDSRDGVVPEHDGRWFDLADAANGFSVWIELALHEAVERARYCSCLLQQYVLALRLIDEEGMGRIRDITYTADEVMDGEPPAWDTSERDERVARRLDGLGVDELKAGLEDLLVRLREPRLPPAQPLDPSMLQPFLEESGSFPDEDRGEALEAMPRGRLYLLDEPEQRLHPVLQRRAARWLGALMSEWGAQCVLATHSVAFMDLPGDTRSYEITRTEDVATVMPLDTASLTPYSQLAREMGLDRGELLSLTRAFLVTTAQTATILDELCADRLAQAHVTVVAVDQDRQRPEMLATALLAQLSAIPLAVLFTAITPDKIDELRDLSAPQRRQEIAITAEEQAVAALIDFSIQQEVEVEILTSNVPSILDLIDETALTRLATGPAPFPGHLTAHERHQNSPDPYERFVKDSYGLTIDEATLRAAARDMRGAGLAPQPLTDALWRLEQLTINL